MKIIFYIFLFIICFFLQLMLTDLIEIRHIRPDFLLIFVVWFAQHEGKAYGTLVGFFAGLFQDVYLVHFFGLSALGKSICGFIAGLVSQQSTTQKSFWFLLNLGINSFVHDFIYYNIYLAGTGTSFFSRLFFYIIPSSFYTFIIGIIFYSLVPRRYEMR
ncbi:rod shape-determining protein MreD [candidate division KSB1 bacterium]|nr:rod shape-determining protein MreD [candidate division KSB1 bacterium]